jgi:hypothetical protein
MFTTVTFCDDKYQLLETNMWTCVRGKFLIVLAVYKLHPGQSARKKQLYAIFKSATWQTQNLFGLQQPSIPPYKMHLSVTLRIFTDHASYVVQSIISWTGCILALLCITADMWRHEMVPCPFCSCSSKKQLRACGVFRKKVTVLKGSRLRAAEIENVAVWATGKRQVLPKIRQIR